MNSLFKNILITILSLTVVLLSIGVSISKMHCSTNGELFIGSEVPNCFQQQNFASSKILEEMSCCNLDEVLLSCCPKQEDNSCSSETKNFQFTFETTRSLLSLKIFNNLLPINYNLVRSTICLNFEKTFFNYDPPLSRIVKPIFSKIQSFLL